TPMRPLEYRMIRAGGQEMWVLDRGTVFRRADGRPYRLAGTITDNTERKRMEAALAASERELRIMFDMAATGTVLASLPDARYLRVNERFGQITGYSEAELIGMSAFDVTHPDDRPTVRRRFARVSAGEVERGA